MKECPKRDRNRPDFMAPSPRAIIESGGIKILHTEDEDDDEAMEKDPFNGLDPESRRIRYYESNKALGYLYRSIDERRVLREIHNNQKSLDGSRHAPLMLQMWDYFKRNNVLLEWEHNRNLARQIKEA